MVANCVRRRTYRVNSSRLFISRPANLFRYRRMAALSAHVSIALCKDGEGRASAAGVDAMDGFWWSKRRRQGGGNARWDNVQCGRFICKRRPVLRNLSDERDSHAVRTKLKAKGQYDKLQGQKKGSNMIRFSKSFSCRASDSWLCSFWEYRSNSVLWCKKSADNILYLALSSYQISSSGNKLPQKLRSSDGEPRPLIENSSLQGIWSMPHTSWRHICLGHKRRSKEIKY